MTTQKETITINLIFIVTALMIFGGATDASETVIRSGLSYTTLDAARMVDSDPDAVSVELMDPASGGGVGIDLHDAEAFYATGDIKELFPPGSNKAFEISAVSENYTGEIIVSSIRARQSSSGAKEIGITTSPPIYQDGKALGRLKCSDVTLERAGAVVFEQEYDMEVFHDLPMVLLPDQSIYHVMVEIKEEYAEDIGRLKSTCKDDASGPIVIVHKTRFRGFDTVRAALPDGSGYVPIEADTLSIAIEVADASTGTDQSHRLSKVQVRGWDMEKITLRDGHVTAWGGLPVRTDDHTLLAPSAATNSVFMHPLGLADNQASRVRIETGSSAGVSLQLGSGTHGSEATSFAVGVVMHNQGAGQVGEIVLHDLDGDGRPELLAYPGGLHHAAHELTHVVQQARLRGAVQRTTDVTGEIILEEGREMVFLGNGIPSDELFIGINLSEPGGDKDFGPYVAGRNYWVLAFPPSEIMLNDGTFVFADELRLAPSLAGHDDTYAVEEIEFVVERVERAKTGDAPVVLELKELRLYNSGDYDVDLGLPPSRGGLVREGADICFEIPDGAAANIQWDKDGAILPGAVGRRLCLANVRIEDSGKYTATYEDGTKGLVTYSVVIFVSNALPVASSGGVIALILIAALAGISASRRAMKGASHTHAPQ